MFFTGRLQIEYRANESEDHVMSQVMRGDNLEKDPYTHIFSPDVGQEKLIQKNEKGT